MEYFNDISHRYIEYYKLHNLVFELSTTDICEKKISFWPKFFYVWTILMKFYAVKNTKAKGKATTLIILVLTVVTPITRSENGPTRKHAIGKRRVGPGNIGHLSKTFPLVSLRYIFKVSMI